ncbi:VWA domain-containing protein [Paracraurococcus lichenis]|uniref:VWA domain-containing protein n=1 Tax=Paracraurococcus lichenis TaxID=3064888 RepID=A0ABT9DUB8_9PROT|nr:VWA domain-containing protein [Paracraurococcus sp. LOR1-02]MDO9707495.1 VWA domain-containing protein [Paracraurococcus sp. LOR1-02]
MEGPLLDFFRAARGAGMRISPAESIDATRAAQVVGFADRAVLKDTLSLVMAKTVEEKRAFAEVFDLFFRRGDFASAPAEEEAAGESPAPPGQSGEGEGGQGQGGEGEGRGGGDLARMLLANDQAALAAAVERAAQEAGLSNIALFTQVNLFTRRILERMGLQALEREIARGGDARLRQGRDRLRDQVRDFVEQNLQLFARGENEAFRERMLQQTRLSAIDRRDHDRMRALVRAMARRLATQYGRNRKRDRRGVLDVRRTLRRNMGWEGIPFHVVWKQERIEKPKLVVLCDVSGSVAAVAQFLLLFLYSLNEALSGLRSFAFSGNLVDVSDILERHPIETAIPEVMARAGFGSSNYGMALADFEREHMPLLDSQSTVIVLGDGRGNRTDPRTDILARMADRSKQVVWLNPEMRTLWGTGDSDMLRYAPHCRVAAVCNTLQHLERIIGELLRDGG